MVQGEVKNAAGAVIHPAYVISGDSLLAATDTRGKFNFNLNFEGSVSLTCSAVNYHDTTMQIQAKAGRTVAADFTMKRDNATGRVYGEFQDNLLLADAVKADPSIKDWNPKQVFDGTTGATIQAKWFGHEVPERRVFLGDSLVAVADGFGQFWFKVQCGTYPIKGTCEGYVDAARVVTDMKF
jgi:ribosomal protein L21E